MITGTILNARGVQSRRILITGGAGFIGHHIAEHFLKNTQDDIVLLDKLARVAPGWDRVRDIEISESALISGRLKLVSGDFSKPIEPGLAKELGEITHILHLGAESHVDSSIKDPFNAIECNVLGTQHLIDYALSLKKLELFLYFSTDEVYGPANNGENFKEGDRYFTTNPYAATKAAAELLCMSAANTWKLPAVITNTMNVFGERQHPEKLIPKVIGKLRRNEKITIHGDAQGNSGSRYWIHARNVAAALLFIIEQQEKMPSFLCSKDVTQGRYNIVGEREITTLDLVKMIANKLGTTFEYEVIDAAAERPGHDFRYALDGYKLLNMGWTHPKPLEEALDKTLDWMTAEENAAWL